MNSYSGWSSLILPNIRDCSPNEFYVPQDFNFQQHCCEKLKTSQQEYCLLAIPRKMQPNNKWKQNIFQILTACTCYITLVGHGKRKQKVLTITKADFFYYLLQDTSAFLTCNPKDKETDALRSYNCQDKQFYPSYNIMIIIGSIRDLTSTRT